MSLGTNAPQVPEKHAYALELNAEFFAEQSTAQRTAA
jgi:hypothetical protein